MNTENNNPLWETLLVTQGALVNAYQLGYRKARTEELERCYHRGMLTKSELRRLKKELGLKEH